MAGIVATLPQMFIDAFNGLIAFDGTTQVITLGIIKFILITNNLKYYYRFVRIVIIYQLLNDLLI